MGSALKIQIAVLCEKLRLLLHELFPTLVSGRAEISDGNQHQNAGDNTRLNRQSSSRESPKAVNYVDVAWGEWEQTEFPGEHANSRIVEYHSHTSLKASSDEVAWCSAFMNYCMDKAGLKGTNLANAKSWLDWGVPATLDDIHCVVVLWRDTPSSPSGHVAILLGKTDDKVFLLGGNQDNKVCVKAYPRSRVIGCRLANQ